MNKELAPYTEADLAHQNLVLSPPLEARGEDRVNFNSLISTLRRRRLLFLSVALTIFAIAMFLTFSQTPVYSSNAQIVIDTQQIRLAPRGDDVMQEEDSSLSSGAVDTEVQVLMSSELANKVAEALKLDSAAAFDPARDRPSKLARFRAWWNDEPLPVSARAYDPAAQREFIIGILKGGLSVLRTGTTYALSITYSSPDPQFAANVANEYARQYTQQAVDRKRDATGQALTFLSKRIEELRKQAQIDTQAVQQYRISNNLLSANAASLTEQEVSTYNQQLAGARAAAAEDVARYTTAQQQLRNGSNGDDVGEALGSGVVSSLKTQRASLAADLANMKTRLGPKHPDVVTAQNQLADLDSSIQTEVNRVISNLQAKVRVSNQRLGSVAGSLGGARGTLANSNRAMVGLDDLSRKAAASQGLYETYLNRYKEAAAQEGTEQATARVISWAQVAGSPSSPKIGLNVFLAICLGAGAGLSAAFIAELLFSGLTTGLEVESRLGVRYLGLIPTVSSIQKKAPAPEEAILENPHSAFSEAFRSLKTTVSFAVDHHVQVVVVTSALPKEGKSTTSICLARSAALEGERVVLLDCDPNRRTLNKIVPEAREVGLIDVLRGEAALEDALVLDEASGAYILPLNRTRAGNESIAGEPMEKLLNELRGSFTYIVIDTPPLLPIADGRVLSTYADAVIFVTRWRKVSDHTVRAALKLLPRGRVHLAGVVLSRVDMRKQVRFGQGDAAYYYNEYKSYYE